MRKAIALIAILGLLAMYAMPALAQPTYSNTLYGQEGGGSTYPDGVPEIDASGQGPAGNATDNVTNWKWQDPAAGGTWSGVYSWDTDAWCEEDSSGDSTIIVECDIELYWAETYSGNEIYFHLGSPFTATTLQKTAYVNGTYACNHLEYVGISFNGTSKVDADFELGGPTGLTGRVLGGMVGTIDNHNQDISGESFDILFLCRCDANPYVGPCIFGAGAHSTIPATLWWHPNDIGMSLGTGTVDWLVRIEPPAAQADGNYELDPEIVTAPEL